MTIFFDLDGPILDVSEKYFRLYCDIVCEYGGESISKDDYWDCKRRRIPETNMLKRAGLTGSETDFMALRKSRIETESSLAYDRIWPETENMLALLAGSNELILVTLRHNRTSLMQELDRLKLSNYFSAILSAPSDSTAHEHSNIKVSLVNEAFPGIEFSGWFVGDTATDIMAGKKLGLNTAAVTYGIRTPSEFHVLAPDVLVHTPVELSYWAKLLCEGVKEK